MSWEAVIGLEVHAQLATRTKLFCPCAYEFGAPANTRVCPTCSGQPGSLPRLNGHAVALAVRAALALDGTVAVRSCFDRKNYFYADLPKGYQITQYQRPYCTSARVELPSGRRIRLSRIHLEEDAGKALHGRGSRTWIDLNRAGVPLIEAVTEPDLRSAEEAVEFLETLREAWLFAGVSAADMEKGNLRCDVNVSLRPVAQPGEQPPALRTKVELKNLNSFRNVGLAITHEIERQGRLYHRGETVRQETRRYDVETGRTVSMRSKEAEADYRYFAEPDLPELVLTEAFLEEQRAQLPEPARERRRRYVEELELGAYDAGVLTTHPALSNYFDAVSILTGRAKQSANWITNDLLGALRDGQRMDELRVDPRTFADLLDLLEDGTLHRKAAQQVLAHLLEHGGEPGDVAATLGLQQVRDTGQVEAWCREALEGREELIASVRAGNTKALGAAMGPVLRASGGSADPQLVRSTLLRLIEEAQ